MFLRRIHVAINFSRQRHCISRCLSTSNTSEPIPWFVSPDEPDFPLDVRRKAQPIQPVVRRTSQMPPLPEDTPVHLKKLHSELSALPYLDPSCLVVTRSMEPIPGPPLPQVPRKGRRRLRGGTTDAIGIDAPGYGLWSWFVLAQVKEGSENKGSINRVVKIVRKMLGQLATSDPAVTLPPKGQQSFTDGWAMLDVGDFAVHIISRDAREKWFPTTSTLIHDAEL